MAIRFDVSTQTMASARWLAAGQSRFASAAARLSSGLRINRPGDDAAGLGLVSKMQAQTTGWNQAQQNIQDGLSLAQVADGAMSKLGDVVQRMRQLAVQSANGVYGDTERLMLQNEFDVLRGEIFNTVDGTKFNGITLLKGQEHIDTPVVDILGSAGPLFGQVTFDGVTLNGDPGVTGGVSAFATTDTASGVYEITVLQAPTAGQVVGGAHHAVALPAGAGAGITFTLDGPLGTAVLTFAFGSGPASWVADINGQTGTTGVTASLQDIFFTGDNYLVLDTVGAGGSQQITVTATSSDPLNVHPEDYLGFGAAAVTDRGDEMVVTINGVMAAVGSSATSTSMRVIDEDNAAFGLNVTISNPPPGLYTAGPFPVSAGFVNVQAFEPTIVELEMSIHSGPNQPNSQSLLIKPMSIGALAQTGANTIGTADISTQSGALDALDVLDTAVTQVAEGRSLLGGDMGQLEAALGLAANNEDSQHVANTRITDADVAAESTELVKAQLQTETAAAAIAYVHADAARTLQLITESQVDTQAPAPAPDAAPAGGSAAGGGAAAAPIAGSGAPPSVSLGGYTASGVTPGFTASPATPGFMASPVTPGYAPLPVLGGGSGGSGGGLSSSEMLSMIAGSLA